MEIKNSYCNAVGHLEKNNVHRIYHDTAYGFPLQDDNELFGRLILEINQAGLSWTTILNKQKKVLEKPILTLILSLLPIMIIQILKDFCKMLVLFAIN
jgi:hypothetical protein